MGTKGFQKSARNYFFQLQPSNYKTIAGFALSHSQKINTFEKNLINVLGVRQSYHATIVVKEGV